MSFGMPNPKTLRKHISIVPEER